MTDLTKENPGPHPCEWPSCTRTVPYDDEPFCFTHSPDDGSTAPGYSWQRNHPKQEAE